jgi:hypothetical protein
LYIFLTPPHPPRKAWLRELIARIDHKLGVLGGFGMDLDTGVAYFRYGADFRGNKVVCPQDIGHMLDSSALGLAVWERAYSYAHKSTVSPKAALNTSLIEAQVYESTFQSGLGAGFNDHEAL